MIWLRKVVAAGICLAAIGLCWQVFAETAENLWIRGVASRLEAGGVQNNLPPSKDQRWQTVANVSSCGSDTLYSALVVVLKKLDRLDVSKNDGEWASGMGSGQRFLRHMRQCLPTDGNAPLRLAMLDRSIAESAVDVCNLITASRLLAPNEALVLSARVGFYNRLSDRTLETCREEIGADIRTILAYGRGPNFNRVLLQTDQRLRQVVRAEFETLSRQEKRWARREFSAFMDVDGTTR